MTERAAKKDNPRAIYNMGVMYKQGLGVEKNIEKAKEYYEQIIFNYEINWRFYYWMMLSDTQIFQI